MFPFQTSTYNKVVYKFACCGIRTHSRESRCSGFLEWHTTPCNFENWPVFSWHHTILIFDKGIPLASTVRCLHSLLKFDLSNLPPTFIMLSSSKEHSRTVNLVVLLYFCLSQFFLLQQHFFSAHRWFKLIETVWWCIPVSKICFLLRLTFHLSANVIIRFNFNQQEYLLF